MVVQPQQIKRDEQYPLLKVDVGGGDMSPPQQPPSTIITPGWNVACVPKRSWLDRWPELISACWMTLILLGITFLVFYALGMSAYRRQPLIIVHCNTSKPENNMYFHHIVPRGSFVPFTLYSDYLSSMAMEYPLMRINVFFLIDDSLHMPGYGPKHSIMFKRFGPSMFNEAYTMSERDKQELKVFQQRYGNVNITIMPLSYYMAMTPLRYKWKMIPLYYLPFYARIYAVWAYGGIGLDLISFNNKFNNHQMPDRRITAIIKQHNSGIEEKKYIQTLNTINCEEQTEFFNLFYNLISNIFNNTYSFFDNVTFNPPVTTETNNRLVTVSRNYRNKREDMEIIQKNTTELKRNEIVNDIINNTKIPNNIETDFYALIVNSSNNAMKVTNSSIISLEVKENTTTAKQEKTIKIATVAGNNLNITKMGTEIPHVVLFYDFSVLSDGVGPSYFLPDVFQPPMPVFKNNFRREATKNTNKPPYFLSMTSDGVFVAATSRHHPFLGTLLSSGCKRFNPKFAIEDTALSQCSGLLRNDVYCDNIFILD
ncbi:uncharacterized protein [Epargyreus clarus]|uniref:uncharacterized protein n=1 Tax=Epargyreus clarus TaxID=520877 RepID=UPI003C2C57A8